MCRDKRRCDPDSLPLPFSFALLLLLGQMGDRDDALALRDLEEHDPLSLASGDADIMDRAADQLPAIGHQHDLVLVLNGEGSDHIAIALGALDIRDALPAAAGDAVVIGRGALAVA